MQMFYDQTVLKVSRKYGKNSTQKKEAEGRFSEAYDGYFGYRFCYKLRQFVTHRSLQVVQSTWSSTAEWRESGLIVPKRWVSVVVDRDTLLAESGVYIGVLRDELAAMPEVIDVEPLVDEAMEGVRKVASKVRLLQFSDMRERLATLCRARGYFEGIDGQPMLGRLPQDGSFTDGRRSDMEQTVLLFHLIEEVESVLSTL